MGSDGTTRRRWFGAIVLATAIGMLIAGGTVLKGRLDDVTLLIYWLICLLLTTVAMLVALWDARAVQRRTRDERHELLQTTLKNIETEARNRRRGSNGGQQGGNGSL